jgi:hypothetical protein
MPRGKTMNRRSTWVGPTLALLLACPALSGCETLFHNLRARDRDRLREEHAATSDKEDQEGTDKILGVSSPPPKSFFKSSRLSGAWSDEGREIERDLGVR